jgi:succinate dehydrogenase/fumarate reductase flavoprotein subunit
VLVFGAIAGRGAAAHAAATSAVELDAAEVQPDGALLDALLADGGVPVAEVAARLRATMWRNCGVIKSRQSLEEALCALEQLEALRPSLRVASSGDLRAGLECLNLLSLARPIVLASLMREETRGCFWRHDFSEPDNAAWVRSISWRRHDGQSTAEVRPAIMTRLTTPTVPPIGAGCFDYLPAADAP